MINQDQPTAGCLLPAAGCLLSAVRYLLSAVYLLTDACCLRSVACFLLPAERRTLVRAITEGVEAVPL